MKILHIGLEASGRHWLQVIRGRSDVTSVGGVDPDGAALAWTRTHCPALGNACHADLDQGLAKTRADAAIITSPAADRARHAIKALEAGLAVMIETPFAGSLAEAAEVVEAARRAGRVVMVAQTRRHARGEPALRRLVRGGKVGTVTHVSCVDRLVPRSRNLEPVDGDYPQVLKVAAHHFDVLRSVLAANPVSAMARCGKAPGNEQRHGSTTEALLEMDRNIHVQYHGSLIANRREHMLWIEGDAGVLRTDGGRIWWRKRGWPVFLPIRWGAARNSDVAPGHRREAAAALLHEMRAAVVDGRQPETSGEDNLWTLAMVEAVIRSDKTGRVVEVAELVGARALRPAPAPQSQRTGV